MFTFPRTHKITMIVLTAGARLVWSKAGKQLTPGTQLSKDLIGQASTGVQWSYSHWRHYGGAGVTDRKKRCFEKKRQRSYYRLFIQVVKPFILGGTRTVFALLKCCLKTKTIYLKLISGIYYVGRKTVSTGRNAVRF